MRKLLTTAVAGALAAATFVPMAHAQSGQDTGTNRGGATTNSGTARPDAAGTIDSGGAPSGASSKAAPTQGSTSGSGMSRPDAASASVSGAPKAAEPHKATSTDTKN